jgi:hypothetical protein
MCLEGDPKANTHTLRTETQRTLTRAPDASGIYSHRDADPRPISIVRTGTKIPLEHLALPKGSSLCDTIS